MTTTPPERTSNEEFMRSLVLFQADALDAASRADLERLLAEEPEARRQFIELHMLGMAIHDHFRTAAYHPGHRSAGRSWVRWARSRAGAAAAGIVLGVCCTSLVVAYGMPWSGRLSILFSDSFEAGPAPLTAGAPASPGLWGGDHVEIVGNHGAVRPADGRRMLRFLRGDRDGMAQQESRSSDTFRLFDVRDMRKELKLETAVVQLSALFNAGAAEQRHPVSCALTIFALDEQAVQDGGLERIGELSAKSLAMAVSTTVTLDDDPASWQQVRNELRLPPDTDFVMIRVGVSWKDGPRRADFPAHFADDVRLVLGQRPELAPR
jgi:hypothetical protein